MSKEAELKGLKDLYALTEKCRIGTNELRSLQYERDELVESLDKIEVEFNYPEEKHFHSAKNLEEKLRHAWEKEHKIAFKLGKRYIPSEEDLALVEEARKKDEESIREFEENKRKAKLGAEKTANSKRKKIQDEIDKLQTLIDAKVEETNKYIREAKANKFISPTELKQRLIKRVIELMETNRADSIKEALNIYDKQESDRIANNIASERAEIERQRLASEQRALNQQLKIQKEYQNMEKQRLENDRRHQENVESQMRQEANDRAAISTQLGTIGMDIHYKD